MKQQQQKMLETATAFHVYTLQNCRKSHSSNLHTTDTWHKTDCSVVHRHTQLQNFHSCKKKFLSVTYVNQGPKSAKKKLHVRRFSLDTNSYLLVAIHKAMYTHGTEDVPQMCLFTKRNFYILHCGFSFFQFLRHSKAASSPRKDSCT